MYQAHPSIYWKYNDLGIFMILIHLVRQSFLLCIYHISYQLIIRSNDVMYIHVYMHYGRFYVRVSCKFITYIHNCCYIHIDTPSYSPSLATEDRAHSQCQSNSSFIFIFQRISISALCYLYGHMFIRSIWIYMKWWFM